MSAFWWFGVLVFLPLSLNAAQLRNFDQSDLFHLGLSHTTPATVLSATAFASNYSGDVSSGSSINSSVGAVSGVKAPVVYFLFLATDKISNFRIWQAFFTQAHPDQYRVLVHCKFDSCKSMVAGSVFEVVPTVPSYYCTDLVSPMNQLLSHALSTSSGPSDKFTFISDSTLPAKPFVHVYHTLISRDGSDFCIFPAGEWADVPATIEMPGHSLEYAVKHHQWITLTRDHAEKAVGDWSHGVLHDFMSRFRLNQDYVFPNVYGDHKNTGCLDEFWHMLVLYGSLRPMDNTENVLELPVFTNSPLRVVGTAGWQGECDTFVMWPQFLHTPGMNPFERLHNTLDMSSVPHSGNAQRPGWWDRISVDGIHAIRNSDFLFVRKFIDNPELSSGGDFTQTFAFVVLT